jgi:hypothetical protein
MIGTRSGTELQTACSQDISLYGESLTPETSLLSRQRIRHFASVLKDVQAGRDETQCFKGGWSIQHEEVGGFAFCYAIAILNAQRFCGIGGDQVESVVDFFKATHVAEEERQLCGSEHTALPEMEPGVHGGVVAKCDVDACYQQFFDASEAPAFRVRSRSDPARRRCQTG